eukprot:1867777-Pleurochrysis_carterae.AAC.1
MQSGVPPYRSGITLPGARRASSPAFLRGMCFPHALPCPCLRGSHVRTFPARRSALQTCAPPLSRALRAHRRPSVSAPNNGCLRRSVSRGYNAPSGCGSGTGLCEHRCVFCLEGGQGWYRSVGDPGHAR